MPDVSANCRSAPYLPVMMLCCAVLAACGGGGGGNDGPGVGTTLQSVPTPPQQLGALIGIWTTDCGDGERDVYTISRVSADTLQLAVKTDYYTSTDCRGVPTATDEPTAPVQAVYAGTMDAAFVLPGAQAASMVKVDRLALSIAARTSRVSGPGVTRVAQPDGTTKACFTPADGGTLCIGESFMLPASTSSTAVYVYGNEMVTLAPNGATFEIEQHLTRVF